MLNISKEILESFKLINNQSLDFYVRLSTGSPSFVLFPIAILLNIVAIFGIPMNCAILYITLKNNHLRGNTSSILLALTAFFDILHQLGHFLFLYVASSGTKFIPYGQAFPFLCIPLFGCCARFWSIPLIGLDRLVQIAFPKWHLQANRPLYLGVPILANILLATFASYTFYQVSLAIPDLPHTGFINDNNRLELTSLIAFYIITGTGLTLFCYALIGLKVKVNLKAVSPHLGNSSSVGGRLFKSLVIIVGANVGGYLLNIILRRINADKLLALDPVQSWQFSALVGILLNVFIALDAPVLYIYSSDYRACFKRNWKRWPIYICEFFVD